MNRARFGKGAFFDLSYTVLKVNSGILENKGTKGTFLWNFVPNSGLRKFCFGISIVEACYRLSLTKVDAQSMINWTVVGQLSWQYLWARTLDAVVYHRWSSRSVNSTKQSRGSISDSWYLFAQPKYEAWLTCAPQYRYSVLYIGWQRRNRIYASWFLPPYCR